MAEEEPQITIEDLELSLEVYQIESEQKLAQLQQLFKDRGQLDLAKMFYEDRSSIEIKFQSIIGDLIEFLVKQEVATTEKLRKTFYRILENPLLLLFKVSRFEIFDLRLNGFDIELEPIEAIAELAKALHQNIDKVVAMCGEEFTRYDGKVFQSWQAFLEEAYINMIQDKLFVFYSYLRKGAGILRKKFENKVKIVEMFNSVTTKLLPALLVKGDARTVKELSVLNYEIYELENSFDVLSFYMNIPLRELYRESWQELELLATKAQQASNYNLFILQFAKHGKEILQKLEKEKVDKIYKEYLKNALKSILEMWGCRICYYREFCELFTCLFQLCPDEIEILEFCLQHTPDMKKDDIVLLRTNFKLELDKKHGELLSLMRPYSLEDVNDFLSGFYHRTFYNLSFKALSREKVISLLTLINGNSSLAQFFQVVEKAIKEWNHSIDFVHSHKYIGTEFAYPKVPFKTAKESLTLITNLCVLEEKEFNKEYETLIKANTIGRAILDLVHFLATQEICEKLRATSQGQIFITESFPFVQKCLSPASDAESVVQIYSSLISCLDEGSRNSLETELMQYISANIEHFHIGTCLDTFSLLRNGRVDDMLHIFLGGVGKNNQMVSRFEYVGRRVEELGETRVSEEDLHFIEADLVVKNGVLGCKDPAIFKLSDLEVMTNPIQFDRIMDSFYFNLDSNSKKFIEHLCAQWNHSRATGADKLPFYTTLLQELATKYPISIPLLSSVRVSQGETTKRFVEMLCTTLGSVEGSSSLLSVITQNRCIRYRNGRDYVQQEIVPMAMKELIQRINNGEGPMQENFWHLAQLYDRGNLGEFKLDMIQKSIEKLRFEIAGCQEAAAAVKMSEAYNLMKQVFFSKKEADVKKPGLRKEFAQLVWSEVRNYAGTSEAQKELQDVKITEHIIATPFTISQDFNIADYKIKKISVKNEKLQAKNVALLEFVKKLPQIMEEQTVFASSRSLKRAELKRIDLKNVKYDIRAYLGTENIEKRVQREALELIFSDAHSAEETSAARREDNSSFVQFYMKELQIPAIDHKVILQDVFRLLKQEHPTISHLWSNGKNLEYYFMDLLSIFEFAALDPAKRQPENDPSVQEVLQMVSHDSENVMRTVLGIFAALGYSNIWAERLDIFWNNFPIRKFLGLNAPSEESVLSIVLRNTLERESLWAKLTEFLGSLFSTREEQNALMYKVTMDRTLMNLIMKSLSLQHLDKISLMFHSNFNNLRLYTDQLQEGLKALNIASKNRSYNEFIKLSKTVEDEEFYGPMKLFKENFSFFIRIEKEGYTFKKNEEIKLALDRLTNAFRAAQDNENLASKTNEIMEGYIHEISELQATIANRVKSFYLVTKLRDLTYQNSLMIPLIHEVMKASGHSDQQILLEISKVEVFSLLTSLYNELVRFEDDWRDVAKHSASQKVDGFVLQNQVTFCTTRRYSHSMSKVYQKCDLEFDEVLQRCVDGLKTFFVTEVGRIWLDKLNIYPAFLTQSFIDHSKANTMTSAILQKMRCEVPTHEIIVSEDNFIESLAKGLRTVPRQCFCSPDGIKITFKNEKLSPVQMVRPLEERLRNNETFVSLKNTGNIIFNKYKSSEATLEEIEILGYLISYSLLNNIPLGLNLHPSIVSALGFGISQLDYLLDVNFGVWEEMRNVLSAADCSKMGLNFSYLFESVETFKPVRVELVDKGSGKKVNNLNREEYCDLVACYILYQQVRPQVTRLLETVLSVVPKDYIACLPLKKTLSLFYDHPKIQKLLDDYMKKIGVVLPETLIDPATGKRYDNLKDFQNVQWLQECILADSSLKARFWPDETNLFVVTVIGGKGSIRRINSKFLIQHFNSKEELKIALEKI